MADRYYICEMVGRGNPDDPHPWTKTTGPFRPMIYDLIKYQDITGGIKHQVTFRAKVGKFAICNVSSLNFTEVDSYTGETGDMNPPDSLLDVPLDSEMSNPHRSFFGNLLKKYLGYSNAEANTAAASVTTYRQAFDYLVNEVEPGFSIDGIRAQGV